jgi:hypothetical protein
VALTNVDMPHLRLRLLACPPPWDSLPRRYFVIGMIGFYFFVLKIKGKDFMERWGMVRFTITGLLLVLMMSLPVKMFLRLAFNVKYVLVTPWINI